jgi:hypothetical protein
MNANGLQVGLLLAVLFVLVPVTEGLPQWLDTQHREPIAQYATLKYSSYESSQSARFSYSYGDFDPQPTLTSYSGLGFTSEPVAGPTSSVGDACKSLREIEQT